MPILASCLSLLPLPIWAKLKESKPIWAKLKHGTLCTAGEWLGLVQICHLRSEMKLYITKLTLSVDLPFLTRKLVGNSLRPFIRPELSEKTLNFHKDKQRNRAAYFIPRWSLHTWIFFITKNVLPSRVVCCRKCCINLNHPSISDRKRLIRTQNPWEFWENKRVLT